MALTRRQFLASLAGLAALAAPASAKTAPAGTYALAGRVFVGNDLSPLKDHAVLVRDGRIEDVIPAALIKDRPVIDPPGCAILPGVINAHCHRIHTPEERRERWLEHGVTAIGDPGAPLEAMTDLSRSPAGTTATAAFSGPVITPPGGYPLPVHDRKYGLAARSPGEASDAVKRLADRGATLVKLAFEPGVLPRPWPVLDAPTARAACDAGRRLGLTVRCHVQDLSGLEPALDAGVHVVEHVPHRWFSRGKPQPVLTPDKAVIPAYARLLERMVREGVILTPTLDVQARSLWDGPALYEPVRAFAAMGGRLAAGNDFPYLRTDAGMIVRELELLGRAGLGGRDVLRAATEGSAAACGFTDRGVIAKGMRADLLVVDGDPAANFGTLGAPLHIVKDGVFVR